MSQITEVFDEDGTWETGDAGAALSFINSTALSIIVPIGLTGMYALISRPQARKIVKEAIGKREMRVRFVDAYSKIVLRPYGRSTEEGN